jgi:hypothetical protein
MKEAFEVMGEHPLLTLFLGGISVFCLIILADIIMALINKIPSGKK